MDAWPYIPVFKVGTNLSVFLLSDYLVALIKNRDKRSSEYDFSELGAVRWLPGTVFSCCLGYKILINSNNTISFGEMSPE